MENTQQRHFNSSDSDSEYASSRSQPQFINPTQIQPNHRREWVYVLTGIVSGMITRTLTSPLDVPKVAGMIGGHSKLFTTISWMTSIRNGDFLKLFTGNTIACLHLIPYSIVKFAILSSFNKRLKRYHKERKVKLLEKNQLSQESSVGIWETHVMNVTATISAVMISYPLSLLRTRLIAMTIMHHDYNNNNTHLLSSSSSSPPPSQPRLSSALSDMLTEGRFYSGLFSGIIPHLLGSLSFEVSFLLGNMIVQKLKSIIFLSQQQQGEEEGEEKKQESFYVALFQGFLVSALALAIYFPFDTISKRIATQSIMHNENYYSGKNILDYAKQIVVREGFSALYAGFLPSLLRVIPYAVLSKFLYEAFLQFV